jgi:hypothetical protein
VPSVSSSGALALTGGELLSGVHFPDCAACALPQIVDRPAKHAKAISLARNWFIIRSSRFGGKTPPLRDLLTNVTILQQEFTIFLLND